MPVTFGITITISAIKIKQKYCILNLIPGCFYLVAHNARPISFYVKCIN